MDGPDDSGSSSSARTTRPPKREVVAQQVRVSGRALDRAGLVHAYGHCSARVDHDRFIVSPPRPLGLIGPDEDCIEVDVHGAPPPEAAGEVCVHQAIYRRRSDVGAICRSQPPHVMTLSAAWLTPRARHGFSSYFAPAPPLWEDPMLVRDEEGAKQVAARLDEGRAIVLRGNGAVTVGATIEEATVLSWYLEDSARVELGLRSLVGLDHPLTELTAAEVESRAMWKGGLIERMWAYLTRGDPELES